MNSDMKTEKEKMLAVIFMIRSILSFAASASGAAICASGSMTLVRIKRKNANGC